MSIAPNRAVAILTPILFAPLAGSISVLIAKYMPGVTIDNGQLQAVFIAGATIAFGKAALWLKGWQEHEKRGLEPSVAASVATGDVPDLEPDVSAPPEIDLDDDDLDEPHLAAAA
jgi:hypothetical protein